MEAWKSLLLLNPRSPGESVQILVDPQGEFPTKMIEEVPFDQKLKKFIVLGICILTLVICFIFAAPILYTKCIYSIESFKTKGRPI